MWLSLPSQVLPLEKEGFGEANALMDQVGFRGQETEQWPGDQGGLSSVLGGQGLSGRSLPVIESRTCYRAVS